MKLSKLVLASMTGIIALSGMIVAPAAHADQQTELAILKTYINASPTLPKKKVTSKDDVKAIRTLLITTANLETFDQIKPYLSSKSIEMLNQTPLLRQEVDTPSSSDPK